MNKYKLMIDTNSFSHKPTKEETASIQINMRKEEAIKELNAYQLKDYIQKGCSFCCAVSKGGSKDENFISQQLFCIDIDNENDGKIITPEEAIAYYTQKGINPFMYYETFNSTPEKPKVRLAFALNNALTEITKAKLANEILISLCPQADPACKNPSRLFYGTNGTTKKVIIVNPDATITFEDILNISSQTPHNYYTKNNDLRQQIENYPLLPIMEKDNEISHISGNWVYFKTCSICGHKDCLRCNKSTNSFFCFGSNGNYGGTIIEYLIATRKISRKEAIDIFKYELLGLPKEEKDNNIQEVVNSIIKQQVKDLHLGITLPKEINWIDYHIKHNEVVYITNCPCLADFIEKNLHYKFISTSANRNVLKFLYVDGVYKPFSDNEIKGIIKAFIPLKIRKMADVNEIFSQLCTNKDCYIPIDSMNSDENIINFRNGIYHLDTRELTEHSPTYLTSIQLPCEYKKIVSLPKTNYFNNFMDDLTGSDESIKKLIFQFGGVTISNVYGYRMKKALFLVGKGNCGKSVFRSTLINLIGIENCSNIDLKDLETRFAKIQILNKRLIGSSDMSFMKISGLERFKSITGGDYITGEYKGMDMLDFKFNGVLLNAGNQLPFFSSDKEEHVYQRFVIVQCDNVIPEDKQDKHLVEHLLEEKDYIIHCFLEGLCQVIQNGYKYDIPKKCLDLLEQYKIDNDSVLTFIKECMVQRTEKYIHDNITCGKTYTAYKDWYIATHRDRFYENRGDFKRVMKKECGFIRTNQGNEYYLNYTLNDDARRDYCSIYSNTEEPVSMPGVEEDDLPF